jgi:hypothetical protein
MPKMCFSYLPGIENREDVPPIRGSKICFSYPADVPQGIGNRGVIRPVHDSKLCFSYQASAVQPPPDSKLCFSYITSHCFRY